MVSELCTQTLEGYKSLVHFHRTPMLVLSVLNLTFSVVATLGNLLVIRALRKSSSISTTLKNLFLSLAVSDLAVALIPQLMLGVTIAVMLHMEASEKHNIDAFCPEILIIYRFFVMFLASSSFLTVTAIAIDRFLAISLHLRYQELVTPKRIIIALMCLWLSSAIAAFIFISENNRIVVAVMELYGLFVTTVVYIHIFRVARYHQNQILAQWQLHNDQTITILREKKSCCTILLLADASNLSFMLANHATVFSILLNSSLNPLLYCWRYRELRQNVKRTANKILCISEAA